MQSPSIPEFGKPSMTVDPFAISAKSSKSPFRHSRNNSDAVVQGMIARFDSMSIKDYQANHELAMKRVEIAREMAEIESKKLKEQMLSKEDDAKKLREETRKLKKELDEARERERKVVRRLDVVMVRLFGSYE
jgi:seryl-tRNA synthetase